MADLPADGEGLAWIATHGTSQLAFIPGVRLASIVAASLGEQQALTYLRSRSQEHAASEAEPASSTSNGSSSSPAVQDDTQGSAAAHNGSQMSSAAQGGEHDSQDQAQLAARKQCTAKLLLKAATEGGMAPMKWLLALCHPSLDSDGGAAMAAAARRGDLDMLKLLRSGPHPACWESSPCFSSAVITEAFPHPVCVRWLLSQDPPCPWRGFAKNLMHRLISGGHLEALDCLILRSGFPSHPDPPRCMVLAAMHGQVPILQFFLDHFPDTQWPMEVCSIAARKGNLNLLQWLLNQGSAFAWGADVTLAAALGGHLTILQWLLHKDPPCPVDKECTAAAARRGHFTLLQWTRAQQPPLPWHSGCVSAAAYRGDLAMLQWLRQADPPCPWDDYCTHQAAEGGSLQVLEWLCSQGCPISHTCVATAAWKGDLPMLQYLHSVGCSLDSSLYYRAAVADCPAMLQWLYELAVPVTMAMPNSVAVEWSIPGGDWSTSAVMFLADMGAPLPAAWAEKVLLARRTFCTFHGLLRWCRHAVCDPSQGLDQAFSRTPANNFGEQLLIRLSFLPQELLSKIASMADLQHNIM